MRRGAWEWAFATVAAASLGAACLVGAASCSSFDAGPSGASTDAATASDAGASPFTCATVDAQFCWSFDQGPQPLIGPQLTATKLAPSLTEQAKSPPSAMEAVLAGAGTTGVELDVSPPIVTLRCELDIDLVALTSGQSDSVTLLAFDYDYSFGFFPLLKAVKKDDTTARVYLAFLGQSDVDLGNVPVGQWVHASLEADATPGGYGARARVGTNAEGTMSTSVDGGATNLPHFNHVRFGLSTSAQVSWTARYDDLVCHWQ